MRWSSEGATVWPDDPPPTPPTLPTLPTLPPADEASARRAVESREDSGDYQALLQELAELRRDHKKRDSVQLVFGMCLFTVLMLRIRRLETMLGRAGPP